MYSPPFWLQEKRFQASSAVYIYSSDILLMETGFESTNFSFIGSCRFLNGLYLISIPNGTTLIEIFQILEQKCDAINLELTVLQYMAPDEKIAVTLKEDDDVRKMMDLHMCSKLNIINLRATPKDLQSRGNINLERNTPVAYSDGDDGGEDGGLETNGTSLILESKEDNIEVEIENTGKNSRRIRSKVVVQANLQTLWEVLTDYERLVDFIPGLAVSQILEKRDNFVRLFQIGQQDLLFGLKFNAKGTLDCFEKDLQTLPFGQKRDIEFKMVEGDFQLFEGKWTVEQVVKSNHGDLASEYVVGELQTTLVYVVDVKPKLWLPVRLVEGRLCKEIRKNLSCMRQEAEKVFQSSNSALW